MPIGYINDRQLTSSIFPPTSFWDTDIRPVDNGEMAAKDVEGKRIPFRCAAGFNEKVG
jgi:hypothetical protein